MEGLLVLAFLVFGLIGAAVVGVAGKWEAVQMAKQGYCQEVVRQGAMDTKVWKPCPKPRSPR